jgi:hypothetical protein
MMWLLAWIGVMRISDGRVRLRCFAGAYLEKLCARRLRLIGGRSIHQLRALSDQS